MLSVLRRVSNSGNQQQKLEDLSVCWLAGWLTQLLATNQHGWLADVSIHHVEFVARLCRQVLSQSHGSVAG